MYARITHVKMTDVKAAVERINENKHLMTEMTGWISSRIVQLVTMKPWELDFSKPKKITKHQKNSLVR